MRGGRNALAHTWNILIAFPFLPFASLDLGSLILGSYVLFFR